MTVSTSSANHLLAYPKPIRLASFALEEFETAREAFRKGQQSMAPAATDSDPRKYRTWIRKCEAEMEAEEHADLSVGTPVSAKHKDAPTSANVAASATPGDAATPATGRARAPVSSAPTHLRIKFQYYQSYEKITVAVLEKGLQEAEVNVEVGERRLTVRRKGDGALLFDKVLYEEVLPDERKTRFMSSKVRVGPAGGRADYNSRSMHVWLRYWLMRGACLLVVLVLILQVWRCFTIESASAVKATGRQTNGYT